jgi:hypothetical protein
MKDNKWLRLLTIYDFVTTIDLSTKRANCHNTMRSAPVERGARWAALYQRSISLYL